MRYFKTWKEADAVRKEVTKDEARKSIEGSYNTIIINSKVPNLIINGCN